MTVPLVNQTNPNAKGILWQIIGMLFFGSMDAVSKHLTSSLPVIEILWVRYLFFALFGFLLAVHYSGLRGLRTSIPFLQIARGLALVFEIVLFTYAFRYLPLADAHVMAASVPLIVLALAVPILKERVGHRRWFAVVLGFLGVLIILRPGFGNWQPILFLPLLGAFGFAVYLVLTRMAAKFDTIGTSAFYTGLVGLSVLTIFLPLEWKTPTIEEWGWLLLASVLGLCGHISVIKALSMAEASVLQPFFYVVLVWATFLGFIIFDDIPDFITIIGACIIVGSGLYAWYRERVNQNQI
ncbi:MAG: DMT family transporter [Pseudomonadota bacterium]|jgi:drug/metabolite transporter (DMT)-like permease|nr:EamA family transporter [Rhodospirillaceae bacterium]MBO91962.1 EamA family transporter [Rhodospirillaceae bacterium]MEC7973209.1 DMT family transporter [Pseudomonadota bacterium]MEC9100288.1 DMT family transporter [Pseudomonadota bacterium]MED5226704.1 DMT family transporter [Pseudomonadota bacterium]|tara:strand:+ start:45 stop:932 length:888 start_codon:yes stop_codon:yes gene_type:complete